ncbi:MAG TPA: hypothetical protein ENI34_01085 [candidate division WOR-3 bacterium]|uniref:Uncharacterized protein n=1 Tax=candidate division WOR-3 bacterium TaxID=2052148 RepID=A0A9C9ELI0_UNCW3|nr:hypothetical protein [candidate division WOR-3 bacterium]
MSILTRIYLNSSKRRFTKNFTPLGFKGKADFLISMPHQVGSALEALAIVGGLHKKGRIVLLLPEVLTNICRFLKLQKYETIYYKTPLKLFSKEYKSLKEILSTKKFDYLIELNEPPNIAIPYLVPVERRISFYTEKIYPYYNILIKDNLQTLAEFFNIKQYKLKNFFAFNLKEKKEVLQKFNKKKPLLFINDKDTEVWNGDRIAVDEEISLSDPELYRILYFSDAYCGRRDELYKCAKLFNKKIIEE